jgi:transposase
MPSIYVLASAMIAVSISKTISRMVGDFSLAPVCPPPCRRQFPGYRSRAVGAKMFLLPKYSPDPNPIEQAFAKLKHLSREAAARALEGLVAAIGQPLGAYTPQECANYFKNAATHKDDIITL